MEYKNPHADTWFFLFVSHRSQSGMWAVPSLLMLLAISDPKDQVAGPKKTRRTRPGERWINAWLLCKKSKYGRKLQALLPCFSSDSSAKVQCVEKWTLDRKRMRVCFLRVLTHHTSTLLEEEVQPRVAYVLKWAVSPCAKIIAVNNELRFPSQTNGTDTTTKKSASLTGKQITSV